MDRRLTADGAPTTTLAGALNLLAINARPLLLVVPGLLTLGASLAMVGIPLLGWPLYGLGLLGMLVAIPALAALYHASMNRLTWIGLGIVYAGVLLWIPVVLMLVGHQVDNPAAREALLGFQLAPLGWVPGAVLWIGFAFLGLAAYSARALPRGGALAFILAAVLGLLAELGVLGFPAWALGVMIVSFGVVWVASPEEGTP